MGSARIDQDCEDAAHCETLPLTVAASVCRPACTQDEDCPLVDGATTYCRDDGQRGGQCVIAPEDGSCPSGMLMVASGPSADAPVICAWQS